MRLIVLKNHVPINEILVETPDLDERYEIYVGRSEDCHVLIEDPLISRHHLVIKNDGGKWYCEKLSQLGTVSVNGVSAPLIELHDGDEIKCGTYSVMVSEMPRLQPKVEQPVYQEAVSLSAPQPEYQAQVASAPVDEDLPDEESLAIEELEQTEVIGSDQSEEVIGNGDNSFSDNNSYDNDLNSEGGDLVPTDSFGDSDDSGFGGLDDSMAMEEVEEKTSFFKAFVNYQLVLFGEHAPYDRYQIDQDEIFIGRDAKKCQIVLDDPEVSSVHAVIHKSNIDVVLEDLNSSNGTILNGERINKAQLSTGDEFVIGSTSFTLETRSDLLEAESDRLMPVERDQIIEREEIEEEIVDLEMGEVDFNTEGPPEKSIIKRIWKDPAKRKKLIYAVVGLGLLYVMFGDDAPAPPPKEAAKTEKAVDKKDEKPAKELDKQLQEKRNIAYELGINFFEQSKYFEALKEFEVVMSIDPQYKKIATYYEQTKVGLKRLEELEAQKRAEEERIKTKKIIEELLVKAREAVKERQVTLAENYFAQITEKDPENIEVQQLKLELEAWQKEQERIALEKATKEAARKAMVDAMNPGKTFYLKKEWYKAILKLEEFLRRKGTDEDLVKEASDMLSDAKNQLASDLGPLVGKARSLKEGQDLKSAYEAYLDVLKIEPTNAEALNEVDEIRDLLDTRSKRIYREAIIAESLSLFTDAKEKFQEVQQISPSDSEYYRKASDKLRNYLE